MSPEASTPTKKPALLPIIVLLQGSYISHSSRLRSPLSAFFPMGLSIGLVEEVKEGA